jgi:aspartyl-tRNA(Asn)/glutamyl-tRNA(Gln) amidotransferase subunit B
MSQKYIPTIGLEIHAELKTKSKMFCLCRNESIDAKPNKNICPICIGHPGTLPVLNKEAIKKIISLGVAINGKIADFTEWDRKHYFYPDIPKGYQISQYAYPLVSSGQICDIEVERIHLEEDTAKSTHDTHDDTLIDFNRSGVPLMELVTKPVIHDALSAVNFAKELQLLIRYLDLGHANMEKGEMRVEANISVATPENTALKKFGTKTEVKNLNSFKAVQSAIEYEIERQSSLLEEGGVVMQETRGWDDRKQETYSQRSKESSHDYRYFPDPDIPKMLISSIKDFDLSEIKKHLPLLPQQIRDIYILDYGASAKEAQMFVENDVLREYFSKIVEVSNKDVKKIRLAMNYLLTDYVGLVKKSNPDYSLIDLQKISTNDFAEIISMVNNKEINSKSAKEMIQLCFNGSKNPKILAQEKGFLQSQDPEATNKLVDDVIKANPKVVEDYKSGKQASIQFLVGQVMKISKGSIDPESARNLLIEKLK